jgi:group II intron reverse transcriptase/maturase
MDVGEMQTKLASWSQDRERRFSDIYNLLYDRDFLYRAYKNVKSNSGSRTAGVDGQTMRDLEENLGEHLTDLRESLKSQSYDPQPVRRTYIPKGDGRERPLGIPTIKDRIVQEALKTVLEPIYETDFSDHSFGFRPNRRTHDAIKMVRIPMQAGKMYWVIDADIKGFFDAVDHGTLGKIMQDRITDRKVLKLIWEFLKAGVMEDGIFRHSMLGTPQGGIVSPLLANIYLNELDQWAKQWTEISPVERQRRWRKGKGNWRYVRYADDFLMYTNGAKGRAEKMLGRVDDFVSEELNLTLSAKKTEIVHAEDGFEFLGYRFQKKPDSQGVKTTVPKEAMADIKGKIDAATDGDTDVSVRAKIKALNAVLRGWSNYYKYATDVSKDLYSIESYAWDRTSRWLAKKFNCSKKGLRTKVESFTPLRANGVTLEHFEGKTSTYRASPMDKDHPYLEGEPQVLDIIPEDEPWLANEEGRTGYRDRRFEALERDDWTCQKCATDLYRKNAHVHHKKARTGYGNGKEADSLSNLLSLCAKCHEHTESNRAHAE